MSNSELKVVAEGLNASIRVTEVDNTLEYYVESESPGFLEIFGEKGIFLIKDDPYKDEHILELVKADHRENARSILQAARKNM